MDGEANFPDITIVDWHYDLTNLTPSGITLKIPEGQYAIGEEILIKDHQNWKLVGAGSDKTRLFSPKGVGAQIIALFAPGTEIRDFEFQGNLLEESYGFHVKARSDRVGQSASETYLPQSGYIPHGVLFSQGSHGSRASNLIIKNVGTRAIGAASADNVWAENIQVVLSEGQHAYIGWLVQWSDAVGGGCINCSVTSPTLVAGFETFKSKGTQFIDCKTINAIVAANGSGGFLFKNMKLEVLPDSQDPLWFSEYQPMVNINANIGTGNFESLGGRIENISIKQTGYINAKKDIMAGININENNPNVAIQGGVYEAPHYASPSKLWGPLGINSTGKKTVVSDFRVIGKTRVEQFGYGNITLTDGAVRNSVADLIVKKGTKVVLENNRSNSNLTPVIAAIPAQSGKENEPFSLAISVTDANNSANDTLNINQTLTFSLDSKAPQGMSIDSASGVLTWTPIEEQGPGIHSVTVRVTDNGAPALSGTKTFNVAVSEANVAPIIEPISDQNINEGESLSLSVVAKDADFPIQKLTYAIGLDAPSGMAIDDTGVISWTPSVDQAITRPYVIDLLVSDGVDTITVPIKINVSNAFEDKSPVLISAGRSSISDLGLQVLWQGRALASYTVESTSDFVNWSPVTVVTADTNGLITFIDSSGMSFPLRFFRLVKR